jgi:hypothetical protein
MFRQNDPGLFGDRRARHSRYRALKSSASRFIIEELESRVLLNGTPEQRSLPFFIPNLPHPAVAVSTWAQPSFDVGQASTAQQAANSVASTAGLPRMVFVHLHLPTQTDPPLLIFADPQIPRGEQWTSSAVDTQSAAPAGGELAAPFFVITGTESSNDASNMAPAGGEPEYGSGASIQPNGVGRFNFTSVLPNDSVPYSSLPGGPNSLTIADTKHVDVPGMLDPDQTSVTFAIPVGALTESLGLSLREMAGDELPVLGQIDLVNPSGVTVEQFTPMPGPGPSGLQSLTVQLHNPTNGSRLVVQITTAEPLSDVSPSSGAESGTTAAQSQASNANVSFVLDVQRQEGLSPDQGAGSTVQAPIALGTLVVAPTPQGGASVSYSTWTAPDEQDGDTAPAAQTGTSVVASSAPETPESSSQSAESFNVRVSTGPLASRSASPLGPTLASIDAEATQQVDRHERAMSQEIEGLQPNDGELSTVWRSRDTDSELSTRPGSSRFAVPGGPVVDVLGSGRFPMMVTSSGRGQHVPLADLWATLPAFADSENSHSSSAHAEISLLEVPSAGAEASRSTPDSTAVPDYVKAACGLAFGLAMTSGPLLPDLLAGLPRRIPKWLAALRARTRRAGSSSSSS